MNLEEFEPLFRIDGTFDPTCLSDVGDQWMRSWLVRRLSGRDPYLPIDVRVEEDPDALLVDILHETGAGSSVFASIARGILSLLQESRKECPKIPPFFISALRVCQQVRMPEAGSWFVAELRGVVNLPQSGVQYWEERVLREVLFAAIIQVPGLPTSASREWWLCLLDDSRYCTLALRGLGHSFLQRLPFMQNWWDVCQAVERDRELDQMIYTAIKLHGGPEVLSAISRHVGQFSVSLKRSLGEILDRYDGGVYTVLSSHERAIAGAGRRNVH